MPNAFSKNFAVASGSRTEMAMWRSLLAMEHSLRRGFTRSKRPPGVRSTSRDASQGCRIVGWAKRSEPTMFNGELGASRLAHPTTCGLRRLHLNHARHGLDGAGDLRRDLEAAGQLDLDLGTVAEHQHHADLTVAL